MTKATIKAIEEKIENPETTALEMQLLEMYLTVEKTKQLRALRETMKAGLEALDACKQRLEK